MIAFIMFTFVPAFVAKYDPEHVCGHRKYMSYEPGLYDAADWVRTHTADSAIIVSDWETMSFVSAVANRPSVVGLTVFEPDLGRERSQYIQQFNEALRTRDPGQLAIVLSDVPLPHEEYLYVKDLVGQSESVPEVYLVVTRNTVYSAALSTISSYAVACSG